MSLYWETAYTETVSYTHLDVYKRQQLGIDDYIPKPFRRDYLKSRIENLIRHRQVLQSAFLSRCV